MATKEQRAAWKASGRRLEERDAVVHAEARTAQRQRDRWYMLCGLLLIMVGVGLTVWTYAGASESGGSYVIVFGPVIAGGTMFFKGLFSLRD